MAAWFVRWGLREGSAMTISPFEGTFRAFHEPLREAPAATSI
jgi:hypothetical protein